MTLSHLRFNFGNNIQKVQTVDFTNEDIKLNGTEVFQRIPLQEIDLKSLSLPYEILKTKYGWSSNKILSNGKYKVTYNKTDYFMTYLDELDLFNLVVLQQ